MSDTDNTPGAGMSPYDTPDPDELVWRRTAQLPSRLTVALDEVQHPQDRVMDRVARWMGFGK